MTIITDPLRLAVRVEPAVAEAAVRALLAAGMPARPDALAAHRARSDALYEIDDRAARDAAFGRLALAEFDDLGLVEPLGRAVAERPALAGRVRTLLIGESRGPFDEGVTCEPGGEHLGIRIDLARFAAAADLLAWARHAMGHAEDTLDPAFGFVPGWEERTGGRTGAMPGRLHRLWDVTVDARLAAGGRLPSAPARRRHRERIAADLAGISPDTVDAVLELLWDGPRPAFPVLLAWAARPAVLVATAAPKEPGLPRPDRCPLCRFPSDDVVPPEPSIAELVVVDYPDWRPDLGLCGRCTDRYGFAGRLGGRP